MKSRVILFYLHGVNRSSFPSILLDIDTRPFRVIQEAEVLLIVDRVDRNFVNSKFFLWNTADGLEVRFFESEPPLGYECVGRVGLVVVPFVKTMAQTFTGFEEEEF